MTATHDKESVPTLKTCPFHVPDADWPPMLVRFPNRALDKDVWCVKCSECEARTATYASADTARSKWNSRVSSNAVAQTVDEDLHNAFVQAAIEAHVGFQHPRPWADCDFAICDERKRLIHRPPADADNVSADDGEREQAFREFWREQDRDRPFDYAHPERYATFTKRYAPPAATTPAPVEQEETKK